MKVLVTGYSGQLGYDVVKALRQRNIECIGATREEFDLTDIDATADFITSYRPDAVIHCAAYTAVDRAEEEPDLCRRINCDATRHIARACRRLNAKMLYISTDYVFSGVGDNWYKETDSVAPLGVYGATKLAGELAVQAELERYFIVRISWVFGRNGRNFIKTMLELAATRDRLNVVGDQIGSPTYTVDLARLLADMIVTDKYGVYHATNEGVCSWAELARAVFESAGLPVTVAPITTAEYPTRVKRPLNSRLSKDKLAASGFKRLPHWRDALARYLAELRDC